MALLAYKKDLMRQPCRMVQKQPPALPVARAKIDSRHIPRRTSISSGQRSRNLGRPACEDCGRGGRTANRDGYRRNTGLPRTLPLKDTTYKQTRFTKGGVRRATMDERGLSVKFSHCHGVIVVTFILFFRILEENDEMKYCIFR